MSIDLATVWAALIAFAVLAYVILDGFDLGVGILFPFFGDCLAVPYMRLATVNIPTIGYAVSGYR